MSRVRTSTDWACGHSLRTSREAPPQLGAGSPEQQSASQVPAKAQVYDLEEPNEGLESVHTPPLYQKPGLCLLDIQNVVGASL